MFAALVLATLTPAQPAAPVRATLNGVVQGDAGRPLKGATVFISTAAPRQGVGVL